MSSEEWLAARRELLAKEKAYTRLRDQLSRELPWERVDFGAVGLRYNKKTPCPGLSRASTSLAWANFHRN